jgi:hypothetical protein
MIQRGPLGKHFIRDVNPKVVGQAGAKSKGKKFC